MIKELRTLGGLTTTIDKFSATAQNPYTDPSMMESETDKSFSQSTLQQTSHQQVRTNDAAIVQREREINDIAKGIIELADIFKELQNMIIDQGTMLDRIDYNIEIMAENVKGADKELIVVSKHHVVLRNSLVLTLDTQATSYQKKTTKRKILLFLILLVVGMFILLLVKPKRHHSEAENPIKTPDGPVMGDKSVTNANMAGGFKDGAPFKTRSSRKFRNR